MHIEQYDNRRVRKARRSLVRGPQTDLGRVVYGMARFTWYLDQQSARIARRRQLTWYAGVPASYAVSK